MNRYFLFVMVLFITGCNDINNKDKVELNGKVLLESKCSKCHNISFPPKNFTNEVAPSIMAISFHFNDWFNAPSGSEKLEKQLSFISDYVINPTRAKSYCDKDMLKKYGLMPSQKGNVTVDEIRAIGKYVFKEYTAKKLAVKQESLNQLHSLPLGEQLIIKYKCSSCHRVNKPLVGPSFNDIAKKYKANLKNITYSIKYGSKNKWKELRGATMPAFDNISNADLNTIKLWINSLN